MSLRIKICGMLEPENILDIANLIPDIMGFIFYPYSPRYAGETLHPDTTASLPDTIGKAGIFVNADFEAITRIVRKYSLDIVQLHGNERPELCSRLRESDLTVIKTFNIKEDMNFKSLSEFIPVTNYFLFDTFTAKYGGSGNKFDWKIVEEYELLHPFFLSGGIGPDDVTKILETKNPAFYGIDLNSRFENKPGLKNVEILKKFISDIRLNHNSI